MTLNEMASVNHLTLFLTQPLPQPDIAASIYFLWPQQQQQGWHLLGVLSNDKPSAVFKISGMKPSASSLVPSKSNVWAPNALVLPSSTSSQGQVPANTIAQLGIAIEPLQKAQMELQRIKSESSSQALVTPSASSVTSTASIVQKLVTHLGNYILSFGTTRDGQGNECVPIKVFQDWMSSIERKLQADPQWTP